MNDDAGLALAAAFASAKAHYDGLPDRRAATPPAAPAPLALAEDGPGAAASVAALIGRYGEAFSGAPGPRYWGFVNGGVTPAALAGDWLCGAIDQCAQNNGDGIATFIEVETIAMLRDLFGLPDAYGGNFVSGGTMANTTCLAIGLQAQGARFGINVSRQGVAALGPVHILSGESHASIAKAAAMLGLGRDSVEAIALQPKREAVDVAAMAARLAELDGRPVILVANAGTVNSGDFDDLDALGRLAAQHGAHFHVDGAFGLFAALSPDHAPLLRGIERAGTITGDAHKWLNVPYDSGFVFTRHADHQLEMFKNVSTYLPPPVPDPRNLQHLSPENSRRLRALPAWLSLRAYGRSGHEAVVARCMALAQRLGAMVDAEPGFRLLAPVRSNVTCFQLLDGDAPADAEATKAFVDRIAADGRVFITRSMLWGQPCIRVALVNWRTRPEDLDIALQAFRDCR